MVSPLGYTGRAKLWAPEEIEALRRLAAEGCAARLIGDRLGRSCGAVWQEAAKLRICIGKSGAVRAVERDARRRGAEDPPQE